MTPPRSFRLAVVLVIALWPRPPDAAAQSNEPWERTSVRVLPEGSLVASDEIESLRGAGVDAIVWQAGPNDPDEWTRVVDRAKTGGLRILLRLPEDPEDGAMLLRRAAESGFDGLARVFGSLPEDRSELDALFSARAPGGDHAVAAPVAVPDGPVDRMWLLLPGPVALPANPPENRVFETIADFRATHPAVAGGRHVKLSDTPYAFYRTMRVGRDETDEVVVVLGATGRVRLNVAAAFPDDVVLRDVVTGRIGLVSYGQIVVDADPDGIILLEPVD